MNIAIVGATGNVGRKTLEVLEKKDLSIDNLYLLASSKSIGKKINFKIENINKNIALQMEGIQIKINSTSSISVTYEKNSLNFLKFNAKIQVDDFTANDSLIDNEISGIARTIKAQSFIFFI